MNAAETRSGGIRIRRAVESDAKSIASIYNGHVDQGGSTFDAAHWSAKHVVRQLGRPAPDGWFVACNDTDEQVVGWSSSHRFSVRHGYRFSCETAIYLDRDAIGRGIADELQRRVEAHCLACNVHHLMAKIIADNTRSIAFHHRHGFETVGTLREVGNMNDQWIDVTILQKILPCP